MGRSCSKNTSESIFKILTGKSTGKRFFGRPRHRWDDNIRLDLKGVGVNTKYWVD